MVDAAREKRETLPARVEETMAIVREHNAATRNLDQIIIWCDLNDEQSAIERALAAEGLTFSSVHGSQRPEESEDLLAEWRRGDTYALIGKPVMLGQGMNLQQCNVAVFVGVTYKFNDTIQAKSSGRRSSKPETSARASLPRPLGCRSAGSMISSKSAGASPLTAPSA